MVVRKKSILKYQVRGLSDSLKRMKAGGAGAGNSW